MTHLFKLGKKAKKRRKRRKRRSSQLLTPVETPVTEEVCSIDFDGKDYEKFQLLGKGSTGSVYHIRNLRTGRDLAQKVIRVTSKDDKNRPFNAEVNVLRSCTSPHVVKMYEYFRRSNKMYLHLEFMDRGSLRDVITKVKSSSRRCSSIIPERIISKICYSILMGLKYLKEELWVLHRDIKPGNILLRSNGEIKIGDFGMCGNIKAKNRTHMGTELYMSPERFLGNSHHSNSDVWSLGLVAAECGALEYPIQKIDLDDPWDIMEKLQIFQKIKTKNVLNKEEEQERVRKLKKKHFVLDCPEFSSRNFSDEYKDFVSRCLAYEKEDRPEASDLLHHRFIQKYVDTHKRNCEEMSNWLSLVFNGMNGVS